MTPPIINQKQARDFAIACYDTIISEIKAERELKKEVSDVAAEKDTATARS